MSYSIKHEGRYYRLEVNGEFYGNYDTFAEAQKDLEAEMALHMAERMENAAS